MILEFTTQFKKNDYKRYCVQQGNLVWVDAESTRGECKLLRAEIQPYHQVLSMIPERLTRDSRLKDVSIRLYPSAPIHEVVNRIYLWMDEA